MDKQLLIRCAQVDLDYLEDTAGLIPMAKKAAVARAALRLGLDLLREDPGAFMLATPRELD